MVSSVPPALSPLLDALEHLHAKPTLKGRKFILNRQSYSLRELADRIRLSFAGDGSVELATRIRSIVKNLDAQDPCGKNCFYRLVWKIASFFHRKAKLLSLKKLNEQLDTVQEPSVDETVPYVKKEGDTAEKRMARQLAYAKEQHERDESAPTPEDFASFTDLQERLQWATHAIENKHSGKENLFESAYSDSLAAAYATSIGYRDTQEDAHLMSTLDLTPHGQAPIFAVFDGHGGSVTSKYLAVSVGQTVQSLLREKSFIDAGAIGDAFCTAFSQLQRTCSFFSDGSCAIVAIEHAGFFYVANVGDSRAILIDKDARVHRLSEDARPNETRFKNQVEKRGGIVKKMPYGPERVGGILAMARELGDIHRLVKGLSERPKITRYPSDNATLLLACDGLWDVAKDSQVAEVLLRIKDLSLEEQAKALVRLAIYNNSSDNVSALIVKR